jgi:hypothetical protein
MGSYRRRISLLVRQLAAATAFNDGAGAVGRSKGVQGRVHPSSTLINGPRRSRRIGPY